MEEWEREYGVNFITVLGIDWFYMFRFLFCIGFCHVVEIINGFPFSQLATMVILNFILMVQGS